MCQGYRNTHKARPDQVGVGVPDDMDDFATEILREIMEGPYPGESAVGFSLAIGDELDGASDGNVGKLTTATALVLLAPEPHLGSGLGRRGQLQHDEDVLQHLHG